jgi:glutaredoxin
MLYNKFFLITKRDCPYCKEAEEVLKQNSFDFHSIDLQDRPALLIDFKKTFDHDTVPMVFGFFGAGCMKLIGGCDDLKKTIVVEDD